MTEQPWGLGIELSRFCVRRRGRKSKKPPAYRLDVLRVERRERQAPDRRGRGGDRRGHGHALRAMEVAHN